MRLKHRRKFILIFGGFLTAGWLACSGPAQANEERYPLPVMVGLTNWADSDFPSRAKSDWQARIQIFRQEDHRFVTEKTVSTRQGDLRASLVGHFDLDPGTYYVMVQAESVYKNGLYTGRIRSRTFEHPKDGGSPLIEMALD